MHTASTLCVCLILLVSVLEGADFLRHCWQTGEGLPSNAINGLARDQDGFLWIGTTAGMVRFDGVRFEVFSVEHGLPDDKVHSVHIDRAGRVWAGTRKGAAYFENGEWHRVGDLPEETIFAIGEGDDGAIWFGSYWSCWRWSEGRSSRIDLGNIFPDTRDFLPDGSGGVWILTQGHLCRWSADSPGRAVSVAGPWNGHDLRDLARDSSGRMVVCGSGLLLREDGAHWQKLHESMPEGSASQNLACGASQSGDLWVASRDRGLCLLHEDKWSTIDASRGLLPLNDVRSVLVEGDGMVWVGTNGGGLCLIRKQAFDVFSVAQGIGHNVTTALAVGADGTVWVGTDGRGILRFDDGSFKALFPAMDPPSRGLISALHATRDGGLWAGTYSDGLFRVAGSSLEDVQLFATEKKPAIASLFESKSGDLLIGTRDDIGTHTTGVLRWPVSGSRAMPSGPGEPNLIVMDILEDPDGRIWCACGSNGLWRSQAGSWNRIDLSLNGNLPIPVALLEGSNGGVWVGTRGQGLLRHAKGGITQWTAADGLVSNHVLQLLEDGSGNIWIGTDSGLQRLAREELASSSKRLSGVRLGRADGLPSPQFSSEHGNLCAKTGDGCLWFSLASGALRIDPSKFLAPQRPKVAYLESASTDRGLIWQRSGPRRSPRIDVEPGSGTLQFRFTSPEFVAPDRIRFRCRLEGIEQEWQYLESARTASYPSLPPGNYRFILNIAQSDGSWDFTAIDVTIRPRFWQTFGFRLFSAIVSLALLGFGIRNVSLRRASRKIEALRQASQLQQERARIARDLHDELGASLTDVNLLGTIIGNHLPEGKNRERIESIVQRTLHMSKSLDEIVWTVDPSNDGLASTIYYLCSRIQESAGAAELPCRFEIGREIPEWPLDSNQRHNLLMAVNEAVNNVKKHAEASELQIGLHFTEPTLRVEIQDNGRGFDRSSASTARHGLRNMQWRMEAVGGSCEITSSPTGTSVILRLPLLRPKGKGERNNRYPTQK